MAGVRPGRRLAAVTLAVVPLFGLGGCTTAPPDHALRLSESVLELRAMQTRSFEVIDEAVILSASVAVLQDMEFIIDEMERPLGVLTASKVADADSAKEMAGLVLLDILCAAGQSSYEVYQGGCGYMARASDEEKIILTLVVLPSLARTDEFVARVTLQKIVFDKQERVKDMGIIADAQTYQQIFDKLTTSIYLETQQ